MPLFKFLKQVFSEFGKDKGSQMSAAFSYTCIFAVVPLMVVVIAIAGSIFGQSAVEGTLYTHLKDVVGPSAASTIQHAVIHAQQSAHNSRVLVLALIGSVLAAAALTNQLQNSFDTIFAVVPDPKGGIMRFVYVKLKNALTLIAGSLIVAALIAVSAIISAAGQTISDHFGMPSQTIQIINTLGSLAIFIIVLYLIYYVLPDVKIRKKTLFYTSVILGFMFLAGKVILGWVIGHNGTATAYGAAASLITLLLWFYYTSQILFLGAESMKVYGNNRGVIYKSKRYTLKQKTINIKTKNNVQGQAVEKFSQGFTRKIRHQK